MRADGQDDGFPQSLCNRPPSALELDPSAQLDPPALAQREVEPDDLEVRRRASGVLPFVAQPAPGLEQRASQFPVEVVRVPVAVMLECDFVGLFFAGHALRREDDCQPVLERPHVALDLALCLRGWRYEVEHPERPAHAPELGLEVFALLAEHRERVRVQRQRDAYVREHLLERGVVLGKGLALADAAGQHVARRVVLADDDRLPRVLRTPQVQWRGVVLDELAEHPLLPPALPRLLPALQRKELAQQPPQVRLAVLADVGAVAPEAVQPVELVRVERVVGAVPYRRLEHLRQMLDAFDGPRLGVVAAGHSELDGLTLAA